MVSKIKNRIKAFDPESVAAFCVGASATMIVIMVVLNKNTRVIHHFPVTMEQINQLQEWGQGGIAFDVNPKNTVLFALPDKV